MVAGHLHSLTPIDIQNFYSHELDRVSANTVIHYHAIIHRALIYAVRMDWIPNNPSDKVERPKKAPFIGSYYNEEELTELFNAVKGTRIELPVCFVAYYGLRRSEILGLKWSAFDFLNGTFTVRHTVTRVNLEGETKIIAKDKTKNKSGYRTLPLLPKFQNWLLETKAVQQHYQKICGRSYHKEFLDYVFVNELGELMNPNYLSNSFIKVLDKSGLRKIRFHDLRHSCATLLIANGIPLKDIQIWLGHSDIKTTADTYIHMEFRSKIGAVNTITKSLDKEDAICSPTSIKKKPHE